MARTAPVMFATAMLGCGGFGTFGYSSDSIGWVGGADRVYTYEQWQATGERDVVVDQASRDFACATAQLAVAGRSDRAYIVTGCGHRGVFVTAGAGASSVLNMYMRAVNVLAPVPPPRTPIGAIDDAALQAHSTWYIAQRWVRLAAQATVDLGCPADQLTPDFIPQGRAPDLPVVEGCGKRATYLSETDPAQFRLSAVVAIAPTAPP